MLSRFIGRYTGLGVVVALVAIILDQGFKFWALHVFGIADQVTYQGPVDLTPYFQFTLAWNRGVSYGLFQQESQMGMILLVTFRLLATIFLLAWLARIHTRIGALAIGMIIGGAIGNAIDGLLAIEGSLVPDWLKRDGVADFFLFHIGNLNWYVFNIADIAIVAGVGLLLYDVMLNKEPRAHAS